MLIEQCYKKLALELGVHEYKLLADIFRIFYTSKEKLTELYRNKKIDKVLYDDLMKNYPVEKEENSRIYEFENVSRGFPYGFGFDSNNYGPRVNMYITRDVWSSDGGHSIGDRVVVEAIGPLGLNNYQITYTSELSEEIYEYESNNLASTNKSFYEKDPRNIFGKLIYETFENDDIFTEIWSKPENGDPNIITTFKKSGKKSKMWQNENGIYYRGNDLPSIIGEDGTKIWTTVPQKLGVFDIQDEDEYHEKYNKGGGKLYIDRKEGEPAVIKPDGTQIWYKNGKKHRIVYPDGKTENF